MKADRRADLHNLYQAGELFGFEGKNDLGGVAVIAVLESTLHGKDAIIYAIPLLESNLAVGSTVEDVVATGGEVIMEASCGHVPDTYERRGIGEVDEEGILVGEVHIYDVIILEHDILRDVDLIVHEEGLHCSHAGIGEELAYTIGTEGAALDDDLEISDGPGAAEIPFLAALGGGCSLGNADVYRNGPLGSSDGYLAVFDLYRAETGNDILAVFIGVRSDDNLVTLRLDGGGAYDSVTGLGEFDVGNSLAVQIDAGVTVIDGDLHCLVRILGCIELSFLFVVVLVARDQCKSSTYCYEQKFCIKLHIRIIKGLAI